MMSPEVYRQFRIQAPIHVQLRRDRVDPPGGDDLRIRGRVWRIFRDDGHDLYWGQKIQFGVAMIDPGPRGPIAPGGTLYHSWDALGRARWVEAFLSYWNGAFDLNHSQIAGIKGPTLRPVCDPAAEGFVCRGNL
jgi:hypothetical protein